VKKPVKVFWQTFKGKVVHGEKPLGYVLDICVGEKPLKNPYF
jgi:hypothetical protein